MDRLSITPPTTTTAPGRTTAATPAAASNPTPTPTSAAAPTTPSPDPTATALPPSPIPIPIPFTATTTVATTPARSSCRARTTITTAPAPALPLSAIMPAPPRRRHTRALIPAGLDRATYVAAYRHGFGYAVSAAIAVLGMVEGPAGMRGFQEAMDQAMEAVAMLQLGTGVVAAGEEEDGEGETVD
ncbi:hypothetical protein DFP73DRAFT_527764 [Morchella snyderi]|nr:hypothetical protein DFP73DRAFT_527764 [Morchella snyderi]